MVETWFAIVLMLGAFGCGWFAGRIREMSHGFWKKAYLEDMKKVDEMLLSMFGIKKPNNLVLLKDKPLPPNENN